MEHDSWCQYFHSISLSLFYNVSSPVLVHSLLSSTPTYSLVVVVVVVVVVSLSFSQEQLFTTRSNPYSDLKIHSMHPNALSWHT